MHGCCAKILLASLCLLCVGPQVNAYINPPSLSPSDPTAGQPVSIVTDAGGCDAIAVEPGYPHVSQSGSSIRVVFLAFRFTDPIQCNLIPTVSPQVFGSYPPGDYDVTVAVFYYDGFGNPQTEDIGVLPMRVSAAATAPVSASTLSPLSLFILGLSIVAVTWRPHQALGIKTPDEACA